LGDGKLGRKERDGNKEIRENGFGLGFGFEFG
jgi:hypothetical protein